MKRMKTIRTLDGRKIRVKMSDAEIRHERNMTITTILCHTVLFVTFVWASGILG